jgi:hypothetical protein
MANKWKYTLQWGKKLREAIMDGDDLNLVVKCLICCYRELLSKLSDEDKEIYEDDINETVEILMYYEADPDDADDVDYYLEEFYAICDSVRAWLTI